MVQLLYSTLPVRSDLSSTSRLWVLVSVAMEDVVQITREVVGIKQTF